MELIIGGAYQGKLDYAKRTFGIADDDIFECGDGLPLELSKKCITHFERWCYGCSVNGIEPKEKLSEISELISDKVIICNDISCGIVPIEPDIRAWRECVGRTLTFLAQTADSVTRIFCGIPQKLK